MRISHEHRYVFVSNPKACTNTMYDWLENHYGGSRLAKTLFHSTDIPAVCDEYFVFTVVRDPYARIVSVWWKTTRDPAETHRFKEEVGQPALAEFVRWCAGRSDRSHAMCWTQSRWLRPVLDRLSVCLRTESLAQDVTALPFFDAAKPLPGHLNRDDNGQDRPWDAYLTPEAIRAINLVYAEDFERFGYPQRTA